MNPYPYQPPFVPPPVVRDAQYVAEARKEGTRQLIRGVAVAVVCGLLSLALALILGSGDAVRDAGRIAALPALGLFYAWIEGLQGLGQIVFGVKIRLRERAQNRAEETAKAVFVLAWFANVALLIAVAFYALDQMH